MSVRNQIAFGVGVIGIISMVLGITFISAYNHAKDTADAHMGGWMLGIGLLLAFGSVITCDLETGRSNSDEDSDNDLPQ